LIQLQQKAGVFMTHVENDRTIHTPPAGPKISEPPALESLSKDLAYALGRLQEGAQDAAPIVSPHEMNHLGYVTFASNDGTDLPCYGYASEAWGRLVYINVAGPRSMTEAMRSSISLGASITISTEEGSKRFIPAIKKEKNDPPAYTSFEYAQADARVRNVVMILRTMYDSTPTQPQTHLLHTPHSAQTLLRVVADLTGLPVLSAWASALWQIAEDAKLISLCDGGPLSIYRITGDKAAWRTVIQAALNQNLLTF
jgi:hypothetical protein